MATKGQENLHHEAFEQKHPKIEIIRSETALLSRFETVQFRAWNRLTVLEMVPVPSKSPGSRLQPPHVWWATICSTVQYLKDQHIHADRAGICCLHFPFRSVLCSNTHVSRQAALMQSSNSRVRQSAAAAPGEYQHTLQAVKSWNTISFDAKSHHPCLYCTC